MQLERHLRRLAEGRARDGGRGNSGTGEFQELAAMKSHDVLPGDVDL